MSDFELVRVSSDLLYDLLQQRPRPVVLMGFVRQDDGTIDITLQTTDLTIENAKLWDALDEARESCLAAVRAIHRAEEPDTLASGREDRP